MGYPEPKDPVTGKARLHQIAATKGKGNDISNTEIVPENKAQKSVTYYSSHNPRYDSFTYEEFVEREVEDIGNYSEEEVEEWTRKYNLSPGTSVIWVTTDKWIANRYNLSSDEWDDAENIPESEMDVHEIDGESGVLIQETDDGDEGFLFAFNE